MRTSTLFALPLLLTGCFGPSSHVDSNATVAVGGTAARQNGDAYASGNVLLIRHPDALQAIGDVITIIGSVGLACIAGNDSLCSAYAKTTVNSDGSYTFASFRGADTKGSTGEALLFSTWMNGPAVTAPAMAPAGVGADFYIQTSQVTVPALRLWESAGAEDDSSGSPRFSWPSLQASAGSSADDYRVLITGTNGATIWSASANAAATDLTIDPRVTQDFAGQWATHAHKKLAGSGTDFDVTWYAPALAYASHGHVPLSRGKDCWLQGANGPVQQSPCALTDGDLTTHLQPLPAPACPSGQTCTPPPQNNWVYVDLGVATSLSTLVLYDVNFGATAGATVEGSLDAMTWMAIALASSSPYSIVTLSGSARYVRIRLNDPNAQLPGSGNGEIAIF